MPIIVYIVAIMVILLIGALVLLRWKPKVSSEKIQVLTEVLYKMGYEDQVAGKPERSFEPEGNYKLNKGQREIAAATLSVYRHGRQDALEGKPNIAEQIWKNREKQIEILNQHIAVLRGMRARIDRITKA